MKFPLSNQGHLKVFLGRHFLCLLLALKREGRLSSANLNTSKGAKHKQWRIPESILKLVSNRACVCAVHAQLCPTLWDPMDWSPPGSSVHEIFQARILEWAAISSSRESSWPRDQIRISCVSWIGRQILYHCATWEINRVCSVFMLLGNSTAAILIYYKSNHSRFKSPTHNRANKTQNLSTGHHPICFLHSKKRKKVKSLSHVQLFATPWTVAYQAPPSVGFSRQEYWSGLPFSSPSTQTQKRKKM